MKCCRTTSSASTFFAMVSGTVHAGRLPWRAASSRLQGSTWDKINYLRLLRVIPAMFWYPWNLIINVCNQGSTNYDFINMFTWTLSIFIYCFLAHPSFFSVFLSPQPPKASGMQDCGAEKLFNLDDDEWTSSWLKIPCDQYVLTFVQLKVVRKSTDVYSSC